MKKFLLIICLGILLTLGSLSVLSADTFNEHPLLNELVEKGDLPEVEDRLPEEPVEVEPLDSIGEYGGTAKVFTNETMSVIEPANIADPGWLSEPVIFSQPEGEWEPNFIKDYELSEDGKTLEIWLRKGLKWSDGVELTAEDYLFSANHVQFNPELNPGALDFEDPDLTAVEEIDKYHIKMHFNEPNPFWKESGILTPLPKHFWENFHPYFVGLEEANKKAEEAGYDDWVSYWESWEPGNLQIDGNFPPTLDSHILTEVTEDEWIFERNPYFYKVDTDGNQLPYIDKIRARVVSNEEMINGKIISGEVDFAARHTSFNDTSMYENFKDEGNYKRLMWAEADSGPLLAFNLTPEDEGLREVVNDKKFRQAVSLSINREQISERVYFGLYRPYQDTVLPDTTYYKDEYAEAYTDYNPEKAEELLKEIGCKKEDGKWYRPDGEELSWTVVFTDRWENSDVLEILQSQWDEFGFDVNATPMQRENARGMLQAGDEIECWMYTGWRPKGFYGNPALLTAFVPLDSDYGGLNSSQWGLYNHWFASGGDEGIEPPEQLKHLNEITKKMLTTMEQEKRDGIMHELLETKAEHLWRIGIVGPRQCPIIISDDFRNFPEEGLYKHGDLRPYQPSQFYFEDRDITNLDDSYLDEIYPITLSPQERVEQYDWK